MQLSRKLLSYLYSAFDLDPEKFLAIRIQYDGLMTWQVVDGWLYLNASGGSGVSQSIDLSGYTISGLVSHISGLTGYSVPFSAQGSLGALVLIDDSGNISQSNGDHLYGYQSVLWSIMDSYAGELYTAGLAIIEMLKQMVVWTAGQEWLDEWGDRFGIRREPNENDTQYPIRMIEEILRIKSNNRAIEEIIQNTFSLSVDVIDIDTRGDNLIFTNRATTLVNDSNYWCGPEFYSANRQWLTDTLGFTQFTPGVFPFGGFPLYSPTYSHVPLTQYGNLIVTNDSRTLANNTNYWCGPESFSSQGSGGLYNVPMLAAFAVLLDIESLNDIPPGTLSMMTEFVTKYRAAGTFPVFFGKFGNLVHTNTVGENCNSPLYFRGPKIGVYTPVTKAVLDAS
ncbi:MAG: hypothetical protein ACU843_07435 [Gammaproteobacteria bacterium]